MKTRSHGIIFLLICPVLAILSAYMTNDGDEFPFFFGIVLLVSVCILAIMGICNITSHYNAKVCYPVSLALSIVLFVSALILFFGEFDSSALCALLTGASAVVIMLLSHSDYEGSKRRVTQKQETPQNNSTNRESLARQFESICIRDDPPLYRFFLDVYVRLLNGVDRTICSGDIEAEIMCYTYFFAQSSGYHLEMDKVEIEKQLIGAVSHFCSSDDRINRVLQLYEKRRFIYVMILSGQMSPRYTSFDYFEGCPVSLDEMDKSFDTMSKTFIALSDILLDPSCAEDVSHFKNSPKKYFPKDSLLAFIDKFTDAFRSCDEEFESLLSKAGKTTST